MTATYVTTEDTNWNDPKFGKFVVYEGTKCRPASLKEVSPAERSNYAMAMDRWKEQEKQPVLVWLQGRVRVFDRTKLRKVDDEAVAETKSGIDWGKVEL